MVVLLISVVLLELDIDESKTSLMTVSEVEVMLVVLLVVSMIVREVDVTCSSISLKIMVSCL